MEQKYVLVNTKTKRYFKEHEPTNKPVWTDTPADAAKCNAYDGQQIKQRLACQSQNVILVKAGMICPACHKHPKAAGRSTCVDCSH